MLLRGDQRGRRHTLILWISIFFISVVLLLASMEIFLRIMGHKPFEYREYTSEPTIHEYDPITGWRNKPGRYVVPPDTPSGTELLMTFLPHGRRRSLPDKIVTDHELVVVGGSFTQGYALSDHDTYPWKLQEIYPSVEVLNYGTGGYGTYQSLLLLEQELPQLRAPKMVIYGFIGHHEDRNVAPSTWMQYLSRYSRRSHVYIPYATVDENGVVVRHPPERYVSLPFQDVFAVIPYLGHLYVRATDDFAGRIHQKRLVTDKILLEMNELSKANGATLVVAILAANSETTSHYISFLKNHEIKVIDCVFPLTPDMKVAGEGHPNAKMNTLWAECISKEIERAIE